MRPRVPTPIVTPTPIPAFAPVDNPLEPLAGVIGDVGEELAELVCPARPEGDIEALFVLED